MRDSRLIDVVAPLYGAYATGDMSSLDLVFAPNWKDNTVPAGRLPGLDGLKQAIGFARSIMPDLTCAVEDMLVDGDRVAVRVLYSGTNTHGYPGAAATGLPVWYSGFQIHRISEDRVVESWHLEDSLSMLVQLGVLQRPV